MRLGAPDLLQDTPAHVSIHLLTLQDLGLLKAMGDGRRRYQSLASDNNLVQLDELSERTGKDIL